MKRREPKPVRQTISVIFGGVPLKTKRRYVTRAYASRALGEPNHHESVLNSGGPIERKRSIPGGVVVLTTWQYIASKDKMRIDGYKKLVGILDTEGKPIL